MNRRNLLSLFPRLAAVAAAPSFVGCSLSSVYQNILKYVPVALAGFSSVISILGGAGVVALPLTGIINLAVSLVKVGFADLQTVVTQYVNAEASAKPGLLGKISSALVVAEQDIQSFWTGLNIPDANLSSLVQGLLGVLTSTLLGFATQLPPTGTSLPTPPARGITAPPKLRTVKQVRDDFNALVKGTKWEQYAI